MTGFIYVSWEELEEEVTKLSIRILDRLKPDGLVCVGRGGLIPTAMLSDALSVDNIGFLGARRYVGICKGGEMKVYTFIPPPRQSRVLLLIDDVADTGETLKKAKNFISSVYKGDVYTATIHHKPWCKFKPDFYVRVVDKWIIYPWEPIEVLKLLSKTEEVTINDVENVTKKYELPLEYLKVLSRLLQPSKR